MTRRFPRTEAELRALALRVAEGLLQHPDDFPNPPVPADQLKAKVEAFNAVDTATVATKNAYLEQNAAKDDVQEDLEDSVKADRARQLVSQVFRPAEPISTGPVATFNFSEDVPDAYAWADLLARLGQLEQAVRAYDRLDTAPYDVNFWGLSNNWGLLIRSYAERGALYQQLGNRGKAIEMYQKFVDAWGEGDEVVQPMVERARRALAALRGEVAGLERR